MRPKKSKPEETTKDSANAGYKRSKIYPLVTLFFTKISSERIAEMTAASKSGMDFINRLLTDNEGYAAFCAIVSKIYSNCCGTFQLESNIEEYTLDDCINEIAYYMLNRGEKHYGHLDNTDLDTLIEVGILKTPNAPIDIGKTPNEIISFICMLAEQSGRREILGFLAKGGLIIKKIKGSNNYTRLAFVIDEEANLLYTNRDR